MTTKHHILIGLVVGGVIGYFAYSTLATYPVYSTINNYATGVS